MNALIGLIGADTSDSDETALRKRFAVVLCPGTLPLTLLLSLIYLVVGAPIAAVIPGFYTAFTPINQLLLILLLPWLVTLSFGALKQSSVVTMWAALCPLGIP